MFNGEIYETIGDTSLKTVKRAGGEAFHALLGGKRVIVKAKKVSIHSLWKDELKVFFDLEKVGMSYFKKEDIFVLKFHNNIGTLKSAAGKKVLPEAFGKWFLRLCMFDYVIQNGDRHSNNILVLSPTKLLAIDEAVSKRPTKVWCPRFSGIINDKILQSIANIAGNREELAAIMKEELPEKAWAGIYEVTSKYDDLIGHQTLNGLEKNITDLHTGIEWMDYMWAKFGEERYS